MDRAPPLEAPGPEPPGTDANIGRCHGPWEFNESFWLVTSGVDENPLRLGGNAGKITSPSYKRAGRDKQTTGPLSEWHRVNTGAWRNRRQYLRRVPRVYTRQEERTHPQIKSVGRIRIASPPDRWCDLAATPRLLGDDRPSATDSGAREPSPTAGPWRESRPATASTWHGGLQQLRRRHSVLAALPRRGRRRHGR